MKLLLPAVASALLAGCEPSRSDAVENVADQLDNAAAQSDPAAAQVLEDRADAVRAQNSTAPADDALEAAGNASGPDRSLDIMANDQTGR